MLIVPPAGLADNWESNLGPRYWLYAVYDCAATPRLLRIQNPYHTLAARDTGAVIVLQGEIVAAAAFDTR